MAVGGGYLGRPKLEHNHLFSFVIIVRKRASVPGGPGKPPANPNLRRMVAGMVSLAASPGAAELFRVEKTEANYPNLRGPALRRKLVKDRERVVS